MHTEGWKASVGAIAAATLLYALQTHIEGKLRNNEMVSKLNEMVRFLKYDANIQSPNWR